MSSYENGYYGMTSLDYVKVFDAFEPYFWWLLKYIKDVNTPCQKCNSFSDIKNDCKKSFYSFSCGKFYKYGKDIIFKYDERDDFIVVDDQIPAIIRDLLKLIYNDVTTTEPIPSGSLQSSFMGNNLCVYIDRYQNVTVYENLTENSIYATLSVSDKKKISYRKHLWRRDFTYESKRNCSC
jgi:hypothetical protein